MRPKKIWLISDTHFGHLSSQRWINDETGLKVRHGFADVNECDEIMIDNWNKTVMPHDRVYHLGDISMARKEIAKLGRVHGKIVLIKGNHDIHKLKEYLPFVEDIRGSHTLDDVVLSHIPVHLDNRSSLRWTSNIHGHLHEKNVMLKNTKGQLTKIQDPRYLNVCVEQINYTPIELDEALSILEKRKC